MYLLEYHGRCGGCADHTPPSPNLGPVTGSAGGCQSLAESLCWLILGPRTLCHPKSHSLLRGSPCPVTSQCQYKGLVLLVSNGDISKGPSQLESIPMAVHVLPLPSLEQPSILALMPKLCVHVPGVCPSQGFPVS